MFFPSLPRALRFRRTGAIPSSRLLGSRGQRRPRAPLRGARLSPSRLRAPLRGGDLSPRAYAPAQGCAPRPCAPRARPVLRTCTPCLLSLSRDALFCPHAPRSGVRPRPAPALLRWSDPPSLCSRRSGGRGEREGGTRRQARGEGEGHSLPSPSRAHRALPPARLLSSSEGGRFFFPERQADR